MSSPQRETNVVLIYDSCLMPDHGDLTLSGLQGCQRIFALDACESREIYLVPHGRARFELQLIAY